MQKQTFPNHLGWQSAPSENLVLTFPERSRQKNHEQNKTDSSASIVEKIFREKISRHVYPDFRYACHYCGTLDVFIRVSKSRETVEVDCLDCKQVWAENVNGVIASCIC